LGTEKGIKALAKFIEESGAFKKVGLEREGDLVVRREMAA
jgi:hypothetical protein